MRPKSFFKGAAAAGSATEWTTPPPSISATNTLWRPACSQRQERARQYHQDEDKYEDPPLRDRLPLSFLIAPPGRAGRWQDGRSPGAGRRQRTRISCQPSGRPHRRNRGAPMTGGGASGETVAGRLLAGSAGMSITFSPTPAPIFHRSSRPWPAVKPAARRSPRPSPCLTKTSPSAWPTATRWFPAGPGGHGPCQCRHRQRGLRPDQRLARPDTHAARRRPLALSRDRRARRPQPHDPVGAGNVRPGRPGARGGQVGLRTEAAASMSKR